MWEAYEVGNEDMLWSGINFIGGIGGQQQAPCGALSAAAVCLGLRHRCPLTDKQRAKQARNEARQHASELVSSFVERFGTIVCRDLVGLDLTTPEARKLFAETDITKERCDKYVQFVIEKLYELDGES